MEVKDKKYCVLCEVQGNDLVEAELMVKFNGDLIPVCRICHDLVEKDNLLSLLDEESDE